MSDPTLTPPLTAPFVEGQTVRLLPALLEKYPLWAPTHGGTAEVFAIKPSYNRQVLQGWVLFVVFPGESARYMLSQLDIEAA
jgi:hypothetical protein